MVPIRTLTLGVAQPHPLAKDVIESSARALRRAEAIFSDAGYEVQTLRLSTRPVFGDMTPTKAYAGELQAMLDDNGLVYLALGPTRHGIDTIPDLLIGNAALNCTVFLAPDTVRPAARVMRRLADETDEGFGNFRFAGLAQVPAGGPFFPGAYHDGPAALTVGLQSASIVATADDVRAALIEHATPVVRLAERVAGELGVEFGGIDLSPAPNGEDSIGAAFERHVPFGAPGTLAVAAALTEAIKSTALPTCGYNGLMLPVMEDVVIARAWAEGRVGLHDLLAYSSVCGTGLDTVPLPGDSSEDDLAGLLLDVAALADRLRKPLSARLFPVPGTRAGDRTSFTSPYLTNTIVRW